MMAMDIVSKFARIWNDGFPPYRHDGWKTWGDGPVGFILMPQQGVFFGNTLEVSVDVC